MTNLTPQVYYEETCNQDESVQLPFFVYGTLRPHDFNYLTYLKGYTRQELSGFYLPNAKIYSLGRFPALVEKPEQAMKVWGDLIYLPPEFYTNIRAQLDELEWYTHLAKDNWYWRVVREVSSPEGEKVRAWVYIATYQWLATLDITPKPIPEGDWLKFKER
jgi:gamma-glutamylcyclotransferase (GGCT)/AIG2-like uncharacterized protein YtfP